MELNIWVDHSAALRADQDTSRRVAIRWATPLVPVLAPPAAPGVGPASAPAVGGASAPAPAGTASASASATGKDEWLRQAYRALEMSDYHTAAQAAAQAQAEAQAHRCDVSDDMWSMLARAHAGLGRFEEAVVAAQRAIEAAPQRPEHHLTLGAVFEQLGNWDAAERCYNTAEEFGAQPEARNVGVAWVMLQSNRADEARKIIEATYTRCAEDAEFTNDTWCTDDSAPADPQPVGNHLGLALAELAEQVPTVRAGTTYVITAPTEIGQMRTLLDQATRVASDPEVEESIQHLRNYVDRCAKREVVGGRWVRKLFESVNVGWVVALLGLLGLAGLVLGYLVAAAGVLALAALLVGSRFAPYDRLPAWVPAWVPRWVPRWQLNRWAHESPPAVVAPSPRP